jgi:hypothetical protein
MGRNKRKVTVSIEKAVAAGLVEAPDNRPDLQALAPGPGDGPAQPAGDAGELPPEPAPEQPADDGAPVGEGDSPEPERPESGEPPTSEPTRAAAPGSGPRPRRKKVPPETAQATEAAQKGMAVLIAQSAMIVSLTLAQALDPIWDLSEPGPTNEDGTPTRKPNAEALALGAAVNDVLPEIANDPWVKLAIVAGSIVLPRTVITVQNRRGRRGPSAVRAAERTVTVPITPEPPKAAEPQRPDGYKEVSLS